MNREEYYDFLVTEGIATEDEINLVTNIIGFSEESLDKILYTRTGYRSAEQYIEEEGVFGIGTVDNNWGANEMYLWVMNTQPARNTYQSLVFSAIDAGRSFGDIQERVALHLNQDLYKIGFSKGQGKNATARNIAAIRIVDSFMEDYDF